MKLEVRRECKSLSVLFIAGCACIYLMNICNSMLAKLHLCDFAMRVLRAGCRFHNFK